MTFTWPQQYSVCNTGLSLKMLLCVSVVLCLSLLTMAEGEMKEEVMDCKDRTGFFPSQTQRDKYYECRNSEVRY